MCPSCSRHPSAFVVCRALGRTPSYEAYPWFLHQDAHTEGGEENHISPPKQRHEGRGRAERSKPWSSSRRQGEERSQENKTAPKISLQFAALKTKNSHLEGFFKGERLTALLQALPRGPWGARTACPECSLCLMGNGAEFLWDGVWWGTASSVAPVFSHFCLFLPSQLVWVNSKPTPRAEGTYFWKEFVANASWSHC